MASFVTGAGCLPKGSLSEALICMQEFVSSSFWTPDGVIMLQLQKFVDPIRTTSHIDPVPAPSLFL